MKMRLEIIEYIQSNFPVPSSLLKSPLDFDKPKRSECAGSLAVND